MTIETVSRETWGLADWSPGKGKTRKGNGDSGFVRTQWERLLELREALTGSMAGVAQGSRENGIEASPCGQHPADAGSDAADRDFALGLLSHEQHALSEIDHALRRIERGTYGICELSGEPIPRPRLRAIPFARHTVAWQAEVEKQRKAGRHRRAAVLSLEMSEAVAADSPSADDEEDAA